MKYLACFCLLLLLASACEVSGPNKWSDPALRALYDLQDRRDTQGLLPYLSHEDPEYRQTAAEAFASVQDSAAVLPLAQSLLDTEPEVQIAAAYALGQIGHPDGFQAMLPLLQDAAPALQATMAEAMGKCATASTIDTLANAEVDSAAEAGVLWGLYRAGLKRVVSPYGTRRALIAIGSEKPEGVRLAAAHYLNRSPVGNIDGFVNLLVERARREENDEVRMALVATLRKVDAAGVGSSLAKLIAEEANPNVRVNAWRALSPDDYGWVQQQVVRGLGSGDPNEAVATANYIAQLPDADLESVLQNLSLEQLPIRPRAILWGAAIQKNVPGYSLDDYKGLIEKTTDRYGKAALLAVLGTEWSQLDYLQVQLRRGRDPVVTTAIIGALSRIANGPQDYRARTKLLGEALIVAFQKRDLATVAIASGIVMNDSLADFWSDWPRTQELIGEMEDAKNSLELPQDVETLMALQQAVDYLKGSPTSEPVTNPYNHPIQWERLSQVHNGQRVVLTTSKGEIEWALQVNDAPGSVESFLSLVDQGFYEGKTLHRVVPNFVAQGGCPRGDGYGGQPYSLRSEFAHNRYTTGAVGLASAGKDTESCQWFITHSPTPHLDGRYTIFAYVTRGQDVAQQLQEGDVIESVKILP